LARKKISPGALYTLLTAEFRKIHPSACVSCRMPLPYRIDPPDEVSANWRIGTPPPCAHGCAAVIVEIAAAHWPKYDLLDPF
jgi:hypothetical protein